MARTETDRELNTGVKVDTKTLGQITVRELSLEAVLSISKEIIALIGEADLTGDVTLASFADLAGKPSAMAALKKVAAASTDRKESDFAKLPLADWMRVAVALKEVTDFEEMKALFFQLVPMAGAQKATEKD